MGLSPNKESRLVYAVIVVFFGLWAVAIATSHTFGGLIHLLLGASISLLVRATQAQEPLRR